FAAGVFFLQLLPAFSGTRLPVEMIELLLDFLAHVAHAVQVLACGLDAAFGLLAAFLVARDARGLFQVHAQLFRVRLDDVGNDALLDDRVTARTQAGAEEQVGDVTPAAAHAVEEIVRLRIAPDHALDRNLVVTRVLAADRAVGIVEDQLDHGLPDRLASGRTGKDHVGQRLATQAAGRALAHHPADRVDDVGLAATVGADDAGEVGREMQHRRIYEGLETGQLDGRKAHGSGLVEG